MCYATTCPLCRYLQQQGDGAQTTTMPRSFQTRAEEVASIERDIDQFEDLIERLCVLKFGCYRRLNEIQPTIAVIPPEILSRIFTFVLPPSQYNSEHSRPLILGQRSQPRLPVFVTLCAVSSIWRQTALSTPELWTKLEWQPNPHINNNNLATVLKAYLTGAGALPFSLRLETNYDPNMLERTTILENSHQFEELALAAPVTWFSLLGGSFTRLSHLWLRPQGVADNHCDVDLSGMPALRHLTLKTFYLSSLKLPSTQLTTIFLSKIPIDVCYNLLIQCPNLIEFRSIFPSKPSTRSSPPRKEERVELHCLRSLEWSASVVTSIWNTAPFVRARLPSLCKLTLPGENLSPRLLWEIVLAELPKSCDELDVTLPYGIEAESSMFEAIFNAMPRLKRLSIRNCPTSTIFPEVIRLLGSRPPDSLYLPGLLFLSVHSSEGFYDQPRIEAETVLSMLKARRSVLQTSSFYLQYTHDIHFSDADEEIAKTMEQEGFDFSIEWWSKWSKLTDRSDGKEEFSNRFLL